MHHLYFPACPVEGPIDPPVPFHYGSHGCIPNKCNSCALMFEGECTRYMEKLQRFMHLDYGPCGIEGPTDPIHYEDKFIASKVEIPRKCFDCVFLYYDSIRGFECRKDKEKWGGFPRGLDWGGWQPDRIYLQLPPPKITSKALVDALYSGDQIAFLKEYRRTNPDLPYSEAKEDFARLRAQISGNPDI